MPSEPTMRPEIEELGLTEAELQYEDLVDPYGITFWPELSLALL